jgi:hypothetical protein
VVGIVCFGLLQLVRPSIPVTAPAAELQAPPAVKAILEKDCYSCHSDQRRLSWFDEIVPGYWLVRSEILRARTHLSFSTLGSKPVAAQKAALYEAVNMVQLGAMPLPQFVALHPEARMTARELATLKTYLAPWSPGPGNVANAVAQAATAPSNGAPAVSLANVAPEFNGFPFDPSFESWKPLSTTDRGDNNTFRFILGNDVAVKAAQSGNISPWPDGARFAKIAWQQELGSDGLLHPGKFVQVELMLKGARQYKDTEGWGWGRWRGPTLKPYGEGAHFVNECTGCHLPVKGNDYVYTLPVSMAKAGHAEAVNNAAAALPASLPYQPLAWNAITIYVDPLNYTTATLYGNAEAMQARGSTSAPTGPAYPDGAVLALVTWAQREDPHWFGGRIPDGPRSVEFVQVADGKAASYRRFGGAGLSEESGSASANKQRTKFILGLAPVWLP